MSSVSIYREGNYVIALYPNNTVMQGLVGNVFVGVSSTDPNKFFIYGIAGGFSLETEGVVIGDILDSTGTPYTLESWSSFYKVNTGVSGSGGGGGTGTEIVVYNNFNNLPTTANWGTIAGVQYNTDATNLYDDKLGGLYRRLGGSWVRLGNTLSLFEDSRFRVYRKSGEVVDRSVRLNLDNIATGFHRTLTLPNKDGVIATIDDIVGGNARRSNIFIVDIIKSTTNGTVTKTFINHNHGYQTVEQITTDEDVVLVSIEWDRNFEYKGTPKINNVDVPSTGITVIKNGGSYRMNNIPVNISAVNKITCDYAGAVYEINIIKVEPPVIESVVIGGYPSTQTSFKEDDDITVTITADKPYSKLVVLDTGLSKGKTETFSLRTTHTTTLKARGGNDSQTRTITLYVENSDGRSANFITEGRVLNNLTPAITSIDIAYPSSQSALKNIEQATVTITTINTTTVQPVFLAIDSITQLALVSQSGNTFVLRRNGGLYNENINNLQFTLTNSDNNKVVTVDKTNVSGSTPFVVRIADSAPNITTHTPTSVRSNVGGVNISSTFTQMVKVDNTTLQTVNKGTITGSTTTASFATVFTTQISAGDSDTHNNDTVNMLLTITNRANVSVVVNRTYKVRGFGLKTLTSKDISLPVEITPDITDTSKVVVFVGDNNSLTRCSFTTPSTIEPLFSDSTQDDQFHVYLFEGQWFVVFNSVVGAKASAAGWSQNARITIEENI